MANIKIAELHPAGTALFSDSEGFLNELTDGQMEIVGAGVNFSLFADPAFPFVALSNLVSANPPTIYASFGGK